MNDKAKKLFPHWLILLAGIFFLVAAAISFGRSDNKGNSGAVAAIGVVNLWAAIILMNRAKKK